MGWLGLSLRVGPAEDLRRSLAIVGHLRLHGLSLLRILHAVNALRISLVSQVVVSIDMLIGLPP